jgi:hypothetical protein
MDNNHDSSIALSLLYENREKNWMRFEISEAITPAELQQLQTLLQLAKNGLAEVRFPDNMNGFIARITLTGIATSEGTLH